MSRATQRRRIHITTVAGSARDAVRRLGSGGVKAMVALAQQAVGQRFRVTADAGLILTREDDTRGGRADDARRARAIQAAFADDHLAGLVLLRGGAWFTRLLDRIDFDALRRRRRTLVIFGFSEMTSLIALAGQYPNVIGLYDLGPGFLYDGMRHYARRHAEGLGEVVSPPPEQLDGFAAGWALGKYRDAFAGFFRDVAAILDGRGSSRVPVGRLLAGSLPASRRITITGGNLSVMTALAGSRYAAAFDPRGKWLAIEDLNESPGTIDRMLAGLKLSGRLGRADGVILGDFHEPDRDLRQAVFRALAHHLPAKRRIPIVSIDNFGHTYPVAPLPLHREVTLRRRGPRGKRQVTIEIPWSRWVGGDRGGRAPSFS